MQSITYSNNKKDNKNNNIGINNINFLNDNIKYNKFNKDWNSNKIERNN